MSVTASPYGYAGGDPVNRVDPFGACPIQPPVPGLATTIGTPSTPPQLVSHTNGHPYDTGCGFVNCYLTLYTSEVVNEVVTLLSPPSLYPQSASQYGNDLLTFVCSIIGPEDGSGIQTSNCNTLNSSNIGAYLLWAFQTVFTDSFINGFKHKKLQNECVYLLAQGSNVGFSLFSGQIEQGSIAVVSVGTDNCRAQ